MKQTKRSIKKMRMATRTMKIAVLGYPIVFCAFCFFLVFIVSRIVSILDFSPPIINLGAHIAIVILGYGGLRAFFYKKNKQFYSYLLSILILGAAFSVFYSHTVILAAGVPQ